MATSKDPNEMPHSGAFHKSLHCLQRQNPSSDREILFILEILTCNPSVYIMNHPDITVSNSMENSIGLKWIKCLIKQMKRIKKISINFKSIEKRARGMATKFLIPQLNQMGTVHCFKVCKMSLFIFTGRYQCLFSETDPFRKCHL